jgi:tetratricopeptide (TPR) repeat protein
MWRIATIVLLAWSLTGAVVAAQTADDLDQMLAQALDRHQAGDLLGAVEAYKVVLQTSPDRADVRSNLGAAYVALGQYEDAFREYREAVRLEPGNPTYHFNLALALYKAGEPEQAIPGFEQTLKMAPANRGAVLMLADCYLQLERDADVIALLTPRGAEFPDDLAYAYMLGMALVRTGDEESGQILVDRVFRAGESAEGHLLMGMAYLNKKDYASAVPELKRAVELNPELPKALGLYGRALLGSGDQESAAREFQRALTVNPNDFEVNLQLGGIRQRQQRYDEALTYLNRAEAIRPGDLGVQHALATVYLGMGQPERALGLLEHVVAEAPDFLDAHVLLATTYYRLKRKEDGDRQREIVARLTAEQQAKQPGVRPDGDEKPQDQNAPGAPPSQ